MMAACARCYGDGWYLAKTMAVGPIRPFGSAIYFVGDVRANFVPRGKVATCVKSQRCGKCNSGTEDLD